MELLETIVVRFGDAERRISLYHGDLTRLPPQEGVDLLVVSAFPNDYLPTRMSLIGGLDRAGISVAHLANDKAEDLRDEYGCWLSHRVAAGHGFERILVFEPARRGSPPEVVGDIFRCLMPVIEGGAVIESIAMPLVASGDQGWPSSAMFEPLIEAAIRWLELGLRVEVIKVVERSSDKAEALLQMMRRLKSDRAALQETLAVRPSDGVAEGASYDVFLSYSHDDQVAADFLATEIEAHESKPRVFLDRLSIDPGASWQQHIWEALEVCRKVVALYSPTYLTSKVCQEEYGIARIRERNEGGVLVPLYLSTAKLPAYIRLLDYVDCREADRGRLRAAMARILA